MVKSCHLFRNQGRFPYSVWLAAWFQRDSWWSLCTFISKRERTPKIRSYLSAWHPWRSDQKQENWFPKEKTLKSVQWWRAHPLAARIHYVVPQSLCHVAMRLRSLTSRSTDYKGHMQQYTVNKYPGQKLLMLLLGKPDAPSNVRYKVPKMKWNSQPGLVVIFDKESSLCFLWAEDRIADVKLLSCFKNVH
jgi:hypothetical protein